MIIPKTCYYTISIQISTKDKLSIQQTNPHNQQEHSSNQTTKWDSSPDTTKQSKHHDPDEYPKPIWIKIDGINPKLCGGKGKQSFIFFV